MNITIVDYDEKYADAIDKIEDDIWEVSGARNEYLDGKVFKIALKDEEVIGVLYGKHIGDMFHLDVIAIKPEYQKQGIGSTLMEEILFYIKEKNTKNIVATVVYSNNKMNAKGLMNKYNFKELFRIKGYWGTIDDTIKCKICGNKPCQCTCVIFLKEI